MPTFLALDSIILVQLNFLSSFYNKTSLCVIHVCVCVCVCYWLPVTTQSYTRYKIIVQQQSTCNDNQWILKSACIIIFHFSSIGCFFFLYRDDRYNIARNRRLCMPCMCHVYICIRVAPELWMEALLLLLLFIIII